MTKQFLTRRHFLQGACALAASSRLAPAFAAASPRPCAVLGVMSDIHLHLSSPHSIRAFRETLEWYRARRVDAVTITGDLTDFGQLNELQQVAAVWREVFPGNKHPNGKPVEPIFIAGNHDLGRSDVWKRILPRSATKEQLDAIWATSWRANPKGVWEAAFGTPWEPIAIREVKGFKFVTCHFSYEPEVDAFLMAHEKELADDARPFFYMQHCPMNDTTYMGYTYNRNHVDYNRHAALKRFPHAIALTGDSHFALTDDRFIYQGDFTAINCSSDHYAAMRFNKYENGGASAGWLKNRTLQLPTDGYDFTNRNGMVFNLYDDHLEIERWDFHYREPLAATLTVPYVQGRGRSPSASRAPLPFSRAAREPLYAPPEFPTLATLAFSPAHDGLNRAKKSVRQIDVIFPTALQLDPMKRALEYVVTIKAEGAEPLVRYLCPKGFAHRLGRQPYGERMPFAVDELPKGKPLTVSVAAIGCWGKASAPLVGTLKV